MKKIFICFLLFSFYYSFSEDFKIDNIPNPRENNGKWVSQIGNYLTNDDINLINSEIDNIEKETTAEISLVIVPSIEGDIFSAVQAIFDKWKIGKKDKNNGILILVSMEDHKFRTLTGYGVESILTDSVCKILQERIIVPNFKKVNIVMESLNI